MVSQLSAGWNIDGNFKTRPTSTAIPNKIMAKNACHMGEGRDAVFQKGLLLAQSMETALFKRYKALQREICHSVSKYEWQNRWQSSIKRDHMLLWVGRERELTAKPALSSALQTLRKDLLFNSWLDRISPKNQSMLMYWDVGPRKWCIGIPTAIQLM